VRSGFDVLVWEWDASSYDECAKKAKDKRNASVLAAQERVRAALKLLGGGGAAIAGGGAFASAKRLVKKAAFGFTAVMTGGLSIGFVSRDAAIAISAAAMKLDEELRDCARAATSWRSIVTSVDYSYTLKSCTPLEDLLVDGSQGITKHAVQPPN
jgi:hypothetical protein